MTARITYRRRHSYNTRSNTIRVVKTAGSNYTVHYKTKRSNAPRCGECGHELNGIKSERPYSMKWIKKSKKTVNRAYGGVRCHKCVMKKILRAFLIEEHRLIKLAQKKVETKQKQETKEMKKKQVQKKASTVPIRRAEL